MIRKSALFGAAMAVLVALPLFAQTPPDSARTRIAGTIEKLDGNVLTVDQPNGQKAAVTLIPGAKIYGVEKRRVADIKSGDFIASGGVRGTDGKIHAVELRILPEALHGRGEGQRPWNAKPDGVMSNATVGTVSQTADGGVIHVAYQGGESELTVGPDVPILAVRPRRSKPPKARRHNPDVRAEKARRQPRYRPRHRRKGRRQTPDVTPPASLAPLAGRGQGEGRFGPCLSSSDSVPCSA